MNRFKAFVKKEFYHIFRDRRTLVILFGIPLIQLMLFGYALSSEVKNVDIAIADFAHDELSHQLAQRLDASQRFSVVCYVAHPREYEELLRSGKAKEIVVIPKDFARDLGQGKRADIQLIADASEPNSAQLTINFTTAAIAAFAADKAPQASPKIGIDLRTRMLYNEEMNESYNFIPGLMAMILMLISAMMTAISITREKETGTMEILLASPLRPLQIILGKVAPYFLLSCLNAAVILLIGVFFFGVPIKGSTLLLAGEVLLFIFLALSLGIMISSIAKNQMVAMAISGFALMLPTILLSGFIFPIKNMPIPLQIISHAMPPRWFIQITRGIMLKGAGLAELWLPTLIMVCMSGIFILISFKKFKTTIG